MVFDDEVLAAGVRQGRAGVAGVVPEVDDTAGSQGGRQVCGDAGLVADAVGAQGGRHVVVGAGEDAPLAVELVADGIGTQVVVGLGVVEVGAGVVDGGVVDVEVEVDDVDGVGCGEPAGAVDGTCVTAGIEPAGTGVVAFGLGAVFCAGVEPGRGAAGLPGTNLAGLAAAAEVRDFTVVSLTGATSEAGRALTPWRYASAMAVTMLT